MMELHGSAEESRWQYSVETTTAHSKSSQILPMTKPIQTYTPQALSHVSSCTSMCTSLLGVIQMDDGSVSSSGLWQGRTNDAHI